MLRVSVNRDVNGINSVFSALLLSMFCVFHRITSSIQLQRAMAINYVLKRGDAKGEKQWFKYRALWDTLTQSTRSGHLISNNY